MWVLLTSEAATLLESRADRHSLEMVYLCPVTDPSEPELPAAPANGAAFRSLAQRLLLLRTGAVTGATLGWVAWGVMTPGDAFGAGGLLVGGTVLALGLLGGYVAFKGRSRGVRIGTIATSGLCAMFWLAAPEGWWAKPPPPRAGSGSAVPTAAELREAEQETHLTFPASKRILFWDAWRGNGPYLRMKLEMAAADWPAFVAASPFRDQPLQKDASAYLGADHGVWSPYQVAHLVQGRVWQPAIFDLSLGADLSRPDVVVVYLVWRE